MQTFQVFQSVKVTDDTLEHHDQAGSVRSAEGQHEGEDSPHVDVQLDAVEGLIRFPVASLQAL